MVYLDTLLLKMGFQYHKLLNYGETVFRKVSQIFFKLVLIALRASAWCPVHLCKMHNAVIQTLVTC